MWHVTSCTFVDRVARQRGYIQANAHRVEKLLPDVKYCKRPADAICLYEPHQTWPLLMIDFVRVFDEGKPIKFETI